MGQRSVWTLEHGNLHLQLPTDGCDLLFFSLFNFQFRGNVSSKEISPNCSLYSEFKHSFMWNKIIAMTTAIKAIRMSTIKASFIRGGVVSTVLGVAGQASQKWRRTSSQSSYSHREKGWCELYWASFMVPFPPILSPYQYVLGWSAKNMHALGTECSCSAKHKRWYPCWDVLISNLGENGSKFTFLIKNTFRYLNLGKRSNSYISDICFLMFFTSWLGYGIRAGYRGILPSSRQMLYPSREEVRLADRHRLGCKHN